jgi:cytidylate kinase
MGADGENPKEGDRQRETRGMSIVTISRGSYSRGKEVAEKLASALGYECISREIILEASEHFNIPELKLVRAIHDAPTILDRFTSGKERFVAFLRSALLTHLQRDNVVFHGLAGHFFLQGISHVLKVRISADLEDRIREEMHRENISDDDARMILVNDDAERRKWGLYLFGQDTWNPLLYDMVLHIQNMHVDDAVSIIIHALNQPCFKSTDESRRRLDDVALSARVEAALVKDFPRVTADARRGGVLVSVRGSLVDEKLITAKVNQLIESVDGVESLQVNIVPFVVED